MESIKHIDLIIEKENLEDNVREFLIQVFPALTKEEIDVSVFPNSVSRGLVNTMIKCSWKNDSVKPDAVTVRVQNMEMFKEFITNRSSEAVFVQMLHKRNCAPRVIATFKNGFCYEYLKGEILSPETLRQEPVCWLVAKELAKIHATDIEHEAMPKTPLFDNDSQTETFKEKYSAELKDPEKNERLRRELPPVEQMEEELAIVKEHIKNLNSKLVLCHNDVRPENIVYNEKEGKATFVDFEVLRYNYQAYELASHFSRYCGIEQVDFSKYPNEEFRRKWIRIYLETYYEELGKKAEDVTDREVEQLLVLVEKNNLFLYIIMACFCPIMENMGLPIDFLSFGIKAYKMYCQEKDEVLDKEVPQ